MTNDDLIRRGDALASIYGDQDGWTKEAIVAIPAVTPQPVAAKVKPLEWKSPACRADRVSCYSYGCNSYGYDVFPDGAWFKLMGPDGRIGGALPNIKAAQAAAQADYEARIRSALTTAPAHDVAKVEALVEAAEALGAMPEGYCFCSTNRIGDDSKMHEPECRDLRAALAAMKEG